MENYEVMLNFGTGVLLPVIQSYINTYVSERHRGLVALLLALVVGVGVTYADGRVNEWYDVLVNCAMIASIAQTTFFKILKR